MISIKTGFLNDKHLKCDHFSTEIPPCIHIYDSIERKRPKHPPETQRPFLQFHLIAFHLIHSNGKALETCCKQQHRHRHHHCTVQCNDRFILLRIHLLPRFPPPFPLL